MRAQSYLAPTTEPLLIALLERTLISAHLASVLDHPASGLATLISDSRIDDLRLLYTLFGRVEGGHAALQVGTSKWIIEIGAKVNAGLEVVFEKSGEDASAEIGSKDKGKGREEDVNGDATMDTKPKIGTASAAAAAAAPVKESASTARARAALGWVQNVIDLKDKFDAILEKAFSADKAFEKSINDVSYGRVASAGELMQSSSPGLLGLRQPKRQIARIHFTFSRREPQERS